MSLLRLLTTGKSLVGVTEAEGRYRLTSQRLLPHFGATKGPFSASGKADPASTGGGAQPLPQASHKAPAEGCSEPSPAVSGRSRQNVIQGLRRRIAGHLSGWAISASRILRRPQAQWTAPALPNLPKQSLQGELSLDRIKVVRNDLSDADLEVVQVRRPAASARALRANAGSEEALSCGSIGLDRSAAEKTLI